MNILLTGSSGNLGQSFLKLASLNDVKIISLDRSKFIKSNYSARDLEDTNIDVVLHTAANTNVEACEQNQIQSFIDNSLLTERLAFLALKNNAKMVYISSTGVYGDRILDRPYVEYDQAFPTTVHHMSKLSGEKAIIDLTDNFLILRTGWLFGGKINSNKNFVAQRIREAKKDPALSINANKDQIGSPTFIDDVARTTLEILRKDAIGIFNLVNSGAATRFDFIQQIYIQANINKELIPRKAEFFGRKAPVSLNESASNLKLSQIYGNDLPTWQLSLKNYISHNSEVFRDI